MKNFRSIIAIVMVLFSTSAFAHSWYDIECCSDRDCAPASKIETLPNGVMRITVILPIPYSNKREKAPYTVDVDFEKLPKDKIKSSKDENIHLCLSIFETPPRILCIYLPEGS